MEVPEDIIRACFDIAIGSMDWGSGFLSQEEVEQLRALAVLLEVDPWEATPPAMRPAYCPGHEWTEWEADRWHPDYRYRECPICGKHEQDPRIMAEFTEDGQPVQQPTKVKNLAGDEIVVYPSDPDWRDPWP